MQPALTPNRDRGRLHTALPRHLCASIHRNSSTGDVFLIEVGPARGFRHARVVHGPRLATQTPSQSAASSTCTRYYDGPGCATPKDDRRCKAAINPWRHNQRQSSKLQTFAALQYTFSLLGSQPDVVLFHLFESNEPTSAAAPTALPTYSYYLSHLIFGWSDITFVIMMVRLAVYLALGVAISMEVVAWGEYEPDSPLTSSPGLDGSQAAKSWNDGFDDSGSSTSEDKDDAHMGRGRRVPRTKFIKLQVRGSKRTSDPSLAEPDWTCGADQPDIVPRDCVMASGMMFDSHKDLPDGKLAVEANTCHDFVYNDCLATVCNTRKSVQQVDVRATGMKAMNPLVTTCVVNKKRGQWQDGKGILVEVRMAAKLLSPRSQPRVV
ncbi:hypothetical protein B0T11DRAFT_67572 [Plectosphaerella cucumerina]|uniref:Uncharacterized protein n=1 Tax=Plectosphaerella cucumerina TaxID=40658 RepID=A0A8K0TNP6_9PEZI|nr:hypothetical protein B0T11DRAFT_67572 [Plectosphaerella cucumerina]